MWIKDEDLTEDEKALLRQNIAAHIATARKNGREEDAARVNANPDMTLQEKHSILSDMGFLGPTDEKLGEMIRRDFLLRPWG